MIAGYVLVVNKATGGFTPLMHTFCKKRKYVIENIESNYGKSWKVIRPMGYEIKKVVVK